MVGSGTGVPSKRRGAPAVALKAAGRLILLDLGSGTLRSLLDCGLDFNQIDILALSHLHPDHVGDLVPFFFATRYSLGYHRQEPVHLLAAEGFQVFFEKLQEAFGQWIVPPPGILQIKEMAGRALDQWEWEGITLKTSPVNHIETSLAFRVEAEGKAVVYSGDTDVSDSLVALSQGADLLIIESSFPTKVSGHLTPQEAGRVAAQAQVGRLILTHLYPPCDQIDVVAEAAKEFGGEIIRAEDGLSLQV